MHPPVSRLIVVSMGCSIPKDTWTPEIEELLSKWPSPDWWSENLEPLEQEVLLSNLLNITKTNCLTISYRLVSPESKRETEFKVVKREKFIAVTCYLTPSEFPDENSDIKGNGFFELTRNLVHESISKLSKLLKKQVDDRSELIIYLPVRNGDFEQMQELADALIQQMLLSGFCSHAGSEMLGDFEAFVFEGVDASKMKNAAISILSVLSPGKGTYFELKTSDGLTPPPKLEPSQVDD